ncbi:AAA family ATPase [Micromonospora sp. NPDC004336]
MSHATGTARPAPARHEGPLVGRRRELAAARDLVLRALRDRSPRWLSLVGPAGIGRSRLLHELRHAVAVVDDVPVRWCVAHCPPYPRALAPVADLVRGLAGLRADESPATVRRRLAAAVAGLVPPERLTGSVGALAELLAGPDASPGAARGAEVAREVLLALAAREPLVVAVDDLDRAAGALDRFLRRLFAAAAARSLPLAVVAVHRPECADVLPVGRRHRLDVPPLRPVETGRLLRHLLRRADRPATQAARLLPAVGGIPGRAVAYVAALDGAPPARLRVPDAVRREVDAGLDRLDATRRAVLMAAATRDAGVTAPSVARLLGWTPDRALPALRALAASGLLVVHADGRYAVADPVLREVAYARLPRAVRATFALRAGRPARPPVAAPPATPRARVVAVVGRRPLPDPAATVGSPRPTGPVRVLAPADLSKPIRVPAPTEPSKPIRVPAPTEPTKPIRVPAPAEPTRLVRVPAPAEPSDRDAPCPVRLLAPAGLSKPVRVAAPTEPSDRDAPCPVRVLAPARPSKPVRVAATAEPSEPVRFGASAARSGRDAARPVHVPGLADRARRVLAAGDSPGPVAGRDAPVEGDGLRSARSAWRRRRERTMAWELPRGTPAAA